MNERQLTYRTKRSCVHNLRITSSRPLVRQDVTEGLVMPRALMAVSDIAPFEQVIVTKIGGDNWANRMYTFALPGDGETVEARGSIAHLLKEGELCCVITGSQMKSDHAAQQLANRCEIPIIDVRLYPESATVNDLGGAKTVIDYADKSERVQALPDWVLEQRGQLPRVVLSNLLSGLVIEQVEKRGCIEMSAELPMEHMKRGGFFRNQSIFVYNASRGGASAESYVVPSLTKKAVGISGALTAVADLGDVISEAGFVTTFDPVKPVIYNMSEAKAPDLNSYC